MIRTLLILLLPTLAHAQSTTIRGDNEGIVQQGDGNIAAAEGAQVIIGYTVEKHEAILTQRLNELRADLAKTSDLLDRAHRAEIALKQNQLAEVQRQLANLDASFQAKEAELRAARRKLQELAGDLPQDQLDAAKQALYEGNTALADDLFAEVERMDQAAIERAAGAAYERGKLAESDIRWADAARHFGKAARLHPTYDHLLSAAEFASRSGDYRRALRFGEDLVETARRELGETDPRYATALNEHALTLKAR